MPGGAVYTTVLDLVDLANSGVVETGTDMIDSGGDILNATMTIVDFDAFADTLVLNLGDNPANVSAFGDNGELAADLDFSVLGYTFLSVNLATEWLSFMTEEDSMVSLGNATNQTGQYLSNLIANAVVVSQDADGALTVRTLYGQDLTQGLSAAARADFQANFSAGETGGVLVVGDYGGSVMYGHGVDLLGTNSDNIMYSGAYETLSGTDADGDGEIDPFEQDLGAAFSTLAVNMYGGLGNDTMFGSTGGNDDLYGGAGNDLIHGMGGRQGRFLWRAR